MVEIVPRKWRTGWTIPKYEPPRRESRRTGTIGLAGENV